MLKMVTGTGALIALVVLGILGTYPTSAMLRRAAWIGAVIVALLATYNEWKD